MGYNTTEEWSNFQIDYKNLTAKMDNNKTYMFLTDFNGQILLCFSEMLALIPYLLRSLRIKKVIQARDQYCDEGVMPRKLIRCWGEMRVICILILVMISVNVSLYSLIKYEDLHIYSFNNLA